MSGDFKLNYSPNSQLRIKEMLAAYKEANPYRYTNKAMYNEILGEYYKKETLRRLRLVERMENNPEMRYEVLQHISKRENIPDFMCDWCFTYDPRLSAMGLSSILPWIPFPRQLEFIEWFYNLYLNQKSGLVEKSRDMGITWLFVFLCVFEWRWTRGFAGGIGSNKLDNVDKRDEPDSIFEKMRKLMQFLPEWWMPPSFDWKKHDKVGNLVNIDMDSQIGGQGGKDIGRGGRRSFYLVDEAASLDFPMDVDASLSNNTNCQIDLSTPKGMNHFGQKRFSGKVPVFTFHYKDDPRKSQEWVDEQRKKLDPVVFAQELEINYHASVAGLFIKPEWVRAAVEIELKPIGVRAAGLDVAAGGTDKSSLALRFGPVAAVKTFDIANGTELTHTAIDLCNKADVEYLHYDAIGVGHAVSSTIERTERTMKFRHFGMKAGGSKSDIYYDEFERHAKDVFLNARAEWWYLLARRFEKTWEHHTGIRKYDESELISIENDGNLIAQLSSVKRLDTESGKIKAESKDALIRRGVKSPDMADALILAFIPRAGGVKRIMSGMDDMIPEMLKINWDLPEYKVKHYGALVIGKDLSVHFMAAVWDEEDAILRIYADDKFDYPDPDRISTSVMKRMNLQNVTYDRIIGNEAMFQEDKRSFHKELNKSFWNKSGHMQTVIVRKPRKFNELGSASKLVNIVKSKRLKIDIRCTETIKQFSLWKLENAKFQHSGMQQAILLILSELMLYQPFEQMTIKRPEYLPIHEEWDDPSQHGPMEV